MVNLDKLNEKVQDWIYSSPDRSEINLRESSCKRFGSYFLEFGKLLNSGHFNKKGREEIREMFDTANRFGVYHLSIREYLETSDEFTEFVVGSLIAQFNHYTQEEYGVIFPEFRINEPYSVAHLQTLSEFVTLYLS